MIVTMADLTAMFFLGMVMQKDLWTPASRGRVLCSVKELDLVAMANTARRLDHTQEQ